MRSTVKALYRLSLTKPGFICLLLLLVACRAAEPNDDIYREWIKKLSVKKDPDYQNYVDVIHRINDLQSPAICLVVDTLARMGGHDNFYFNFRLSVIKILFYHTDFHCFDQTLPIEELKQQLHQAYILKDPYLINLGNKMLAAHYRLINDSGPAVMHATLAVELQDSLGVDNFFQVAFDRYALGELQYRARQYEKAIHSFREAIRFDQINPEPSGDAQKRTHDKLSEKLKPMERLYLYNTLGLAYLKLGRYDSAMVNFNQALIEADLNQQPVWHALIRGNIGDIYFQQGQYDDAYPLFREDVEQSVKGGDAWADNAANSLQWMARIDIKRGQIRQAHSALIKANTWLQKSNSSLIKANLYNGYMELFAAAHQADSLQYYTTRYLALHDSIEHKAFEARANIVQVYLDNQRSMDEFRALDAEKRRIEMLRNFVILIAMLGFEFVFLYIKRHQLKTALQQRQIADEKRKAELAATVALEQLNVFTQHLLEKNKLFEQLQEQLSTPRFNKDQAMTLEALSRHSILTDDDWDRFKILFEKVYPGFFHQVKTKAPDITSAEIRIAAMTKLRIHAKEASTLLGISQASVNKARQRLRQRLDLDHAADLEEFFLDKG